MSDGKKIIALTVAMALVLTACGNSPGRRAVTGGAIGAGVGAVGATVLGADPLTGAVLGGGVGAVTGAVTKKKDINLGD